MNPRPSTVIDTVLDGILRTALLFSLFLLFAGHNAPGGGFVGGLTAAAALVLRYVAEGEEGLDRLVPYSENLFLGGGVVIATLVGLGGFGWADAFLGSVKVEQSVGVLGKLKATSALPFDVGVYLVVVGLVLAILRALGGEADTDQAAEGDGEVGVIHTDPAPDDRGAPAAPQGGDS